MGLSSECAETWPAPIASPLGWPSTASLLSCDHAEAKMSLSRALNLDRASGVSIEISIDLLSQAKDDTLDRRNYSGKAPIPRQLTAFPFAVVEDRLGLREACHLR